MHLSASSLKKRSMFKVSTNSAKQILTKKQHPPRTNKSYSASFEHSIGAPSSLREEVSKDRRSETYSSLMDQSKNEYMLTQEHQVTAVFE